MTIRIAGSVFCGFLLLAATTNAFADANTAIGEISTTRLKADSNNKTGTFPNATRKSGTGSNTGSPQKISDQAAAGNTSGLSDLDNRNRFNSFRQSSGKNGRVAR